jgi:Flp pilus assembly protein TadD
MYRGIRLLLMVAASGILAGCASTPATPGPSPYQTLGKEPRRDSDLARQRTAQAVAMIEKNEWSQAEIILKQALDADVTFGPAHNNLGNVYLHENNLYLAAWEFQYAAKLMPFQPEPKSNLGLVFEAAGKLDEAVDCYEQAVKIEPDNPQFVGNDARARVRRGDKDVKTRDMLAKVVSVDTRPDWVEWARERLALMGPAPSTEPQGEP